MCEKEVPPGECVCCVSSVCLSVCLSVVFVCEGEEGTWLMLRPTFARAGFEERSVVPEMFSAHYIHTTIHSHTYTTYLPHTHTHTHTHDQEMDEEEAARRVKLMDASDRVAVSRQQQLEQASEEQDMQNDDGEPPLFNLEVRLSAERSEVVAVYAGEDAATLAAAFVATHSLPVKAVAKLTRLIEENVAHYATEIEVVEVNENA